MKREFTSALVRGFSWFIRELSIHAARKTCLFGALLFLSTLLPPPANAAGVTIITHGYGGDVNGWVTGMANEMTNYYNFPGTSSTTYKITLTTTDGTSIYYQWSRVGGPMPTNTYSGEIIIKMDWSQMAGSLTDPLVYDVSTYNVALAASWVFLQTNSISDLGGHALVEFPIHMIGHSRGGSLITEISRILGTNGVWVDHLTTLDPHPLNNDGNDDFPVLQTDASAAHTYQNVLFHDNYWQNIATWPEPDGEFVNGAYNRQLYNPSGGYGNTTSSSPHHSNVHLWYHGTVDFDNPASDSDPANPYITSTERYNWWGSYEGYGLVAGFYYSLIGHGNRLSADQPVGPGFPAIRDGYNQNWDLGAGTSANRSALSSNSGAWPNLIKFNRTDTNQVVQGQSVAVKFFYQWAQPSTSTATLNFYLDNDFNPLNSNQNLLKQMSVPGNGATSISYATVNLTLDATNASPGYHTLYGKITGGGRTRYLYAPELVQVISMRQPPTMDIAALNGLQLRVGVNGVTGQTIVLQGSTDLAAWLPLATNTLAGSRWTYTNTPPSSPARRFYRAVLSP